VNLALNTYATDADGMLPPSTVNGWHPFWYDRIAEYIGLRSAIDESNANLNAEYNPDLYGDAFRCPDATIQAGFVHYAPHPRLMPQGGFAPTAGSEAGQNLKPFRLDQVVRASDTLLAADAQQFNQPGQPTIHGNAYWWLESLNSSSIYWNSFREAPLWVNGQSVTLDDPMSLIANEESNSWGQCDVRYRHVGNQQANVAFVDGHVGGFQVGTAGGFFPAGLDTGTLLYKAAFLGR
jgi:prepilin-type processing-associated H-X9-DG protein